MNDKEFLGKEKISKLLFKLALPTVIAQIINMLYNLVDRIYIGHIENIGNIALTGVGVCLPLIIIITAFSCFVASGSAPRASIYMGRKDFDTAEAIIGGSVSFQVIISIILTVVIVAFDEQLLYLFGASSQTITYAKEYMDIYALGTIFVELTLGLNAFITGQGKTKIAMLTILIGAVLNIALDPLFIFAFGMGVKGAALATIISQGVSCLWCILYLLSKKALLRLKLKNLITSPKVILPCLLLGSATFIMQISESIITMCFNTSLQKYGGDIAVGAMTICYSIMQFAMLPLMGIAQGAQPILSYNYGAKNSLRVKETFKCLLISCMVYSVALYLLIMIFPGLFAGLFTSDTTLFEFTKSALRIYCGVLFLFGIQISCQMTFVSIGNAPCSIIVAVVRKFVLLIPLIYLLPLFITNKTNAVYLAEPVADVLAITFTTILFIFAFKKSLKKISE